MAQWSRRDVGRFLAASGAAAWFSPSALAHARRLEDLGLTAAPLPPAPQQPDERYWRDVRARFLLPRELRFFNAANLCPTPLAVVEAIEKNIRTYEAEPSPETRSALMRERETARTALATALRVTPDEIVITRNTTESNNIVSSGVELKAGDEVVVWADNHPSNLNAWRQKATRFGFTVVTVPVPASHPGADGYVELFRKAFTPRTKLVAITHVSSNSGDLLPAKAICAAAREAGALALVDGAQAFGVLDLDLSDVQPDFYTGSMHKWPCGPKEKGLLYVRRAIHDRISPSTVGLYGGQVGLSRTFEAMGQRDDASIAGVTAALEFQHAIGRDVVERRARDLAQALMTRLRRVPGVRLWTDPDPAHSAAIVIFQPGAADPRQLATTLRTSARVVATARGGQHNPGLRISPHIYNTMDEIDAVVAAVRSAV